jgi:hypothetical protein
MALVSKLVPKYNENEVSFISESGQARWNVYCKGTGLNRNAAPEITVNGTNNLSTYGRGLTLVVWDTNMAVQSTTVYDIYAYDSEQTRLANDLNALSGNKIFAMVSYDAINTNSNLNTAMTTKKSQLWNTKYADLRSQTGGVRYPYACIGTTRLGILKEQIWKDGASDPYAEFTMSFEDWDTIGNVGYGPIYSSVEEISGRGYPFFQTPNLLSYFSLQTNEVLRFSADVRTDNVGYNEGGYVVLWINDGAWTWGTNVSTVSNEYQRAQCEIAYNGSAGSLYCAVYYYNPNSGANGVGYAKNIQIQKVGFSTSPSTARSKMGPTVITSRKTLESPQKIDPGVADTYYNLWQSDRNLLRNVTTYSNQLTGAGTANETVRWFTYNLTSQNEKFIHWKTSTDASGENMYQSTGLVNIDHTKMYYGAVWYYTFFKTSGSNYIGTHTYDVNGNGTNTRSQGGGYNSTNPYFTYPGAGDIRKNRWNLVDCWFLPSTWSSAETSTFHSRYYQKTFRTYNNPTNYGNCELVWLTSSDAKVLLRFLDYYNGNYTTKTWWALPLLVEVSPMTISNYEFSSWHLKEV